MKHVKECRYYGSAQPCERADCMENHRAEVFDSDRRNKLEIEIAKCCNGYKPLEIQTALIGVLAFVWSHHGRVPSIDKLHSLIDSLVEFETRAR